MVKNISVPRGTADILPEDIFLWQDIELKSRNLFKSYNYREIRTPIFEETALFTRSLGQTSDVVNKQLLNLAGDKKDGFSLRPEGTASIVRSYIQNGLDRKESLSKLFYFGPMFRGERPQKGRLRQFHQIGVEAIGANSCSPLLDAEIIQLSVKLLNSFGLNNFQLKINTLGTKEDKANFSKVLRKKLSANKNELCEDCRNRFDRNVFRILDCKNKKCQQIVDGLEIGHNYLSERSCAYFTDVQNALNEAGIAYEVSDKLVRGLDYYTHTVFEISDSSLGSQDALGAGGRYGDLVKQLGGPDADAIGFALGIERIILALDKKENSLLDVLDVYLVALDVEASKHAFILLSVLRENNIKADMSFKVSSMKSQMRQANKLGASAVIILGEDELRKNCVIFKDMKTSDQGDISIEQNYNQLIEKFKERK